MNKSVTLAQIGCGYWGPNLLRNFAAHEACVVKWVIDVSPPRRQYVENHYPTVRTSETWQAIVEDNEVDAIAVATPAASHFQLVKTMLEHGNGDFDTPYE